MSRLNLPKPVLRDPDPGFWWIWIPDPGFLWPKIRNIYSWNKFIFFIFKKCNSFIFRLFREDLTSYMRSTQPPKDTVQHLKTQISLTCSFLLHFCLSGSGSTDLNWILSSTDPDPKRWPKNSRGKPGTGALAGPPLVSLELRAEPGVRAGGEPVPLGRPTPPQAGPPPQPCGGRGRGRPAPPPRPGQGHLHHRKVWAIFSSVLLFYALCEFIFNASWSGPSTK